MKIYHYHKATGELCGESEARIDPLELEKDNRRYVIPANATVKKPLPMQAQKAVCFDALNDRWEHRDDHRGATHYDPATGRAMVVTEIGIVPDVTSPPPPDLKTPQWDGNAWVEGMTATEIRRQVEERVLDLRVRVANATGLSIAPKLQARLTEAESELAAL